ncbi:MAG: hypothetical protein R6V50_08435 [Thermoplasmatota archaeon]
MKITKVFLSLAIIFSFLLILFIPFTANASNAGVGVLNVAPQYSIIRLVQQDNFIRMYLTVSDYNSWQDILSISVILEESETEKAKFTFRQYADKTSYEAINEFSENLQGNLLDIKRSSYSSSDGSTVEEKCNLELLFVFQSIWFTKLKVVAMDRAGSTATIDLEYSSDDISRSGNIIIIPGINRPTRLEIEPYLLDVIAILFAILATRYVIKKRDIGKIMSAIYEKT